MAHQPKDTSELSQPNPGPRPAWSPGTLLKAQPNIDSRRQRDPLLRGERDDGGDGGRDGLQRAGAAARGALLQEHHRARRRRQPKLRRHELVGGRLFISG